LPEKLSVSPSDFMEINLQDEELIVRIGQKDESSLVMLMERHKQAVFHFVYRYLGNENDSMEIVEATFLRVYQYADRFKLEATVKTWIFSIALNLARDRLRKIKRHSKQVSLEQTGEQAFTEINSVANSGLKVSNPSIELLSKDDQQLIEEQIRNLPEKLRFPFIFCVMEDHSYDDCASILKSTRKTVETRIYRARQLLRAKLSTMLSI